MGGGCKLILITLTGLEVLVLEDVGFLTAICMYTQIGSKQKMSGDKIRVKQRLKFLCLLPLAK